MITKLDDPDPVKRDSLLLYTLRVTNEGSDFGGDVVVVDELPLENVDLVRVTSRGFRCDVDGDRVRCERGSGLGADRSATIEIVVDAEEVGTIQNTAEVRADGRRVDADTESTRVEARDDGGGGGGNNPVNVPQENTTPDTTTSNLDTTNPETTAADANLSADANRPDSGSFRCDLFLRVVRDDTGALRAQYRGDELIVQRFEQCLSEDVLAATIPDRNLPFTGGPSLPVGGGVLLLVAAALLAGRIIRR